MARRFNIAGPCRPELHYMIPAERRLTEAPRLVDQGAYFVLHAPRQTGKTTVLHALAEQLTASGRYAALRFSCEVAASAGDIGEAQRTILTQLRSNAEFFLPAELQPPPFPEGDRSSLLGLALTAWARSCPRPLVLLFDEIDALGGPSLLNVLHQLRAGYTARPAPFPWSVILCGRRNVRDDKAGPFNISVDSLRLRTVTQQEVHELYAQHTAETGQPFTEQALERAWELTQGHPWLVNALAREVVEKMGVPAREPITANHIDTAKERLILARTTHLGSLLARLREPTVRRVLESILAGELVSVSPLDDDYQYITDLGLIAPGGQARLANPIYRELISRLLVSGAERNVQGIYRHFPSKAALRAAVTRRWLVRISSLTCRQCYPPR